jgi:hypothetical protein
MVPGAMDESGKVPESSSAGAAGFCQSMSAERGSVGNGKTSFEPVGGGGCFSDLGEEETSSVDPFRETGA